MPMFDPTLEQKGSRNTAPTAVPRLDYLDALVQGGTKVLKTYQDASKGNAEAADASKGKAEAADTSILVDAMKASGESDLQDYQELGLAEQVAAVLPDLFKDGQIDPEEEAMIKKAGWDVERVRSLADPTKRKVKLMQLRRAFMDDPRLQYAKPATVEKIAQLFDIRAKEEPAKGQYAEKLYNSVLDKYTNPSPWHFALEAKLQRDQAEYQAAKQEDQLTGDFMATKVPVIVDGNIATVVSKAKEMFDNLGALSAEQLAWLNQSFTDISRQVRSEIAKSVQEGKLDPKSAQVLMKDVEDRVEKARSLKGVFGVDNPEVNSRISNLFKVLGEIPGVVSGGTFGILADVSGKIGLPVYTMIQMGKDPKEAAKIAKQAGLDPKSTEQLYSSMTRALDFFTDMDESKLVSAADKTLMKYLAGKWVTENPTAAPKNAFDVVLDEVSGATDAGEVGTVLWKNPNWTVAALKHNDPRAVSVVRNKIDLMVGKVLGDDKGVVLKSDEKGRLYTTWAPGTKYYKAQQVTGGPEERMYLNDGMAASVTNWRNYLGTQGAKKLLGEDALEVFNAALEGRAANKAPAQRPAAPAPGKWKMPTADVIEANRQKYESIAVNAAEEAGLPPEMVTAHVLQESAWDPMAVSEAGAKGLMQLTEGTAKMLGLDDKEVHDPRINIQAGVDYLAQMYRSASRIAKNEDERQEIALAMYNWGPGNVRRLLARKGVDGDWSKARELLPDETKRHILKVRG